MRSTGIWMLIIGIGGFVLPMMGIQFVVLAFLGDATPYVAAGLAIVGAILVGVSFAPDKGKPAQ